MKKGSWKLSIRALHKLVDDHSSPARRDILVVISPFIYILTYPFHNPKGTVTCLYGTRKDSQKKAASARLHKGVTGEWCNPEMNPAPGSVGSPDAQHRTVVQDFLSWRELSGSIDFRSSSKCQAPWSVSIYDIWQRQAPRDELSAGSAAQVRKCV